MAESQRWGRHQGKTPKTRPANSSHRVSNHQTIPASPMNEPQTNAKTLSGGVANKPFSGRARTRGGKRA